MSSYSSWEDTSSVWHPVVGYGFELGVLGYGTNDAVDVNLSGITANVTLTEALSGDFDDSKTVSAADYVLFGLTGPARSVSNEL